MRVSELFNFDEFCWALAVQNQRNTTAKSFLFKSFLQVDVGYGLTILTCELVRPTRRRFGP